MTSSSKPAEPAVTHTQSSPKPLSISHGRQKSQEERDYEQQAALVAQQLAEKDRQLCEVIMPPPEHKMTTDFMSGIFDTDIDHSRRPSLLYQKASPRKDEDYRRRSLPANEGSPLSSLTSSSFDISSLPLDRQKEELVGKLQRKMETLTVDKSVLEDDIKENEQLGKEISAIVEKKCQSRQEIDKFRLYVDELDKVTILLLKLSCQLAKAENSVLMMPAEMSDKQKAFLESKRDRLSDKLNDAKDLKEGIDRRSQQVATYLQKYLTPEEFSDYEHFVKMKSKLTIDQQELDDKIKLGEEQLEALQKSMNS